MSAHSPLSNETSSSLSSWWSSTPKVYGGYSYSPFDFECVRSFFASLSSQPSLPSFFRTWAADAATYEDDFWFINIMWCIAAFVGPMIVYALEMKNPAARRWWRSQRSFQPPQWLNCLCVVQFIISNNLGLFTARYWLGRPLNSVHSYSFFGDFLQFFLYLPIIEVVTYTSHFVQHWSPLLYKWTHSTHHKVKFSTMWIVYYAHPFDFLINTSWLYAFFFYVFDFHFSHIIVMVFFQTFALTLTHSNYREVNNGHHSIHHLEPRYNFCPGNPLVDKLFGTLMSVEEYCKIRDPEKLDGGDKDE